MQPAARRGNKGIEEEEGEGEEEGKKKKKEEERSYDSTQS